jgi:RNA polymerase sigma-70 factor (ECF subfamily)
MRSLARRLLGDGDAADDVVQETWLNALRVPPARGGTLRPWIATVMLNLVRSRARREARARTREERAGGPEPARSAEELLAQRQTERLLAELVLALEEPYRTAILRRFHDGRSSAEIARAEGIPEGTVRWRLKHALDELRRRLAARDGGTRVLGALVPIPLPAVVAGSPSWLGGAALIKGSLTLIGASAVALVIAAGVRRHAGPVRSRTSASSLATSAGHAPSPIVVPMPDVPLDGASRSQSEGAQVAGAPPSRVTAITGVVRDSRGDAAARVPVTLRTLAGSGVADRVTTTDETGRFSYRLQSHGRFMLTAELKGEPAARLEIAVPRGLGGRLEVSPTSVAPTSARIDLAFGATPRPVPTRSRAGWSEDPLSRWCCRQAFAFGEVVHGRACLRFEDAGHSDQSGCDLYGLKRQVSCRRRVQGGLSTGDLSRTDRLDCDGRLL